MIASHLNFFSIQKLPPVSYTIPITCKWHALLPSILAFLFPPEFRGMGECQHNHFGNATRRTLCAITIWVFGSISAACDSTTVSSPNDGKAEEAFARMQELEAGSIANPDENRMVGHYWLRNPSSLPPRTSAMRSSHREHIRQFAADVHQARSAPAA